MVFLVEIFNGDGELAFSEIVESDDSSGEIQREIKELLGHNFWYCEGYKLSVTGQNEPILIHQLKDKLKDEFKDEFMDEPIPQNPYELEVPTSILTQKCVCGCLFLAHMAHKREDDGTYVASSCENHSECAAFVAA